MTTLRKTSRLWHIVKIVLSVILLLLILGIGGLLLAPLWINTQQITALVEQQTGRKMEAQNIRVTLFPWVGVTLERVNFANAPGFEQPYFAQVEQLQLQVKLIALLSKQVNMATLRVHGLQLHLARHADGTVNWGDLMRPSSDSAPKPTSSERSAGKMPQIHIDGVDIQQAQVTWDDLQNGQKYVIADLGLKTGAIVLPQGLDTTLDIGLTLPAGQSLPIHGRFHLQGQVRADTFEQLLASKLVFEAEVAGQSIPNGRQTLKVSLAELQASMAERKVQARGLSLRALGMEVKLDGEAAHHGIPEFSAHLEVPPFNLRQTLTALGLPLPEKLVNQAALQADLQGKIVPQGVDGIEGEGIVLRNVALRVDDNLLSGSPSRLSQKLRWLKLMGADNLAAICTK